MAITIDQFRQAAGDSAFAAYLYRARQRFEQLQAATLEQVRDLYRRAAERLADDIRRAKAGTLTYAYKSALQEAIRRRADELSEGLLQLAHQGIRGALMTGVEPAKAITIDVTQGVFDGLQVESAFGQVAERSVMALLARTGPDGLRLSDRVWRVEAHFRQALDRLVEEALVTQMDPRRLARLVQQYVQPGVFTALKQETRRRLKVPRDVSYEAMRLAVTELQHAHHEGALLGYRMTPSYIGSYWMLSGSHPVPDICDVYASHGLWEKGTEPSKPHPWCRCWLRPVFEEREQFIQRLRAWVQQPSTQPDIEQWFRQVMQPWAQRPIRLVGSGLLPRRPRAERPAPPPWHARTVAGADPELSKPLRAALFDGTRAADSLNPVDVSWNDRVQAKVAIMRGLAARLRGNPAFAALAADRAIQSAVVHTGDDIFENAVAVLIDQWAATSADDAMVALALQRAAEEEFGLKPWAAFRRRRAWKQAEDFYTRYAGGLRAFLRAMYDWTQEYFRARGITRVWAWRGMGLARGQYRQLRGFGKIATKLQPMSSFSAEYDVSRLFASGRGRGMMIGAEIPVERIIATARTGFGCLNEAEVVVLSGPGEAWAWAAPTGRELVPYEDEWLGMMRQWQASGSGGTSPR